MRRKKNAGKQAQYRRALLDVIQDVAANRHLMDSFLVDLFTPAELNEFASRWQIVQQLHRDVRHRDVVDALGVGIATVTRGARVLQNPHGGFQQVLRRHRRR